MKLLLKSWIPGIVVADAARRCQAIASALVAGAAPRQHDERFDRSDSGLAGTKVIR